RGRLGARLLRWRQRPRRGVGEEERDRGAMSSRPRSYRGRLLTPLAAGGLRYLDDALVVVEGGRIASGSAGPGSRGIGDGLVLDLRPAVLVPGFVDTHVHFPQARVIGHAGAPLLEWLDRTIFPEEARFKDERYARTVAAEFVAALAAAGTTTSCIY